jgi:hypothetical protein
MKPKFLLAFLFALLVFTACLQPGPVKVSIKLEPPPPTNKFPMQAAPGADLKDVGNIIGELLSTSGKVYGHKVAGNTIVVYLGAAYPNQLLTVILRRTARAAFNNMDGKTVFVTGEVSKHRGKPQMIIDDKANFDLKTQMVRPKADGLAKTLK